MGNCCMDTYELGRAAPNSETHLKGTWFGGLIPEAAVRMVSMCCYLSPQQVLPAGFVVQRGRGALVRLVAAGRAPGLVTAHRGHHLGLGSSHCRVSRPLSWLFFFAVKSIFHARLLPRLQSLLCSSTPWRPLFSLTQHDCSQAPGDAPPLPPCPGCPMEAPGENPRVTL